MNRPRTLAVIPARAGSKRIKGKNVRNFLGRPIIWYPVSVAQRSNLFETIMVSTDSEKTAELVREFGAEVPFLRSSKNADDRAGLAEVLVEVLEEYRQRGQEFEYVCCILATAALLRPEDLVDAASQLQQAGEKATAILSVSQFSYPLQRALRRNEGGYIEMLWPENYTKRSQDLEKCFHDAGCFYFLNSKAFLKDKDFFPKSGLGFLLPASRVQDIDEEEDWKLAELKYRYHFGHG